MERQAYIQYSNTNRQTKAYTDRTERLAHTQKDSWQGDEDLKYRDAHDTTPGL